MNDARTDIPEPAAAPRLIEDHALIGSTEAVALIHRSGTFEWLCLPAFVSDNIFAPVNSAHSLLSNPAGVALLLADDACEAPGEARG